MKIHMVCNLRPKKPKKPNENTGVSQPYVGNEDPYHTSKLPGLDQPPNLLQTYSDFLSEFSENQNNTKNLMKIHMICNPRPKKPKKPNENTGVSQPYVGNDDPYHASKPPGLGQTPNPPQTHSDFHIEFSQITKKKKK